VDSGSRRDLRAATPMSGPRAAHRAHATAHSPDARTRLRFVLLGFGREIKNCSRRMTGARLDLDYHGRQTGKDWQSGPGRDLVDAQLIADCGMARNSNEQLDRLGTKHTECQTYGVCRACARRRGGTVRIDSRWHDGNGSQ
jgi:hypothetical protein